MSENKQNLKITISKSKYTSYVTCPKQFWLAGHRPELGAPPDAGLEARFEQGHEVGELALRLFNGVIDITVKTPDGKLNIGAMREKTQQLIAENCPAIAEAAFSAEGIYCAVDILKNNGDGTWDLNEVKSSTSCKEIYLRDIAFQRYVLTQCGIKVRNCNLIYINNQYVRNGEIEPEKLFVVAEVSDELQNYAHDIPENLKQAQCIYANETEPETDISENCHSPYPCAFYPYCAQHLPEKNIFDIYRFHLNKKFEYYYKGIISYKDIREANLPLNEKQQRQLDFVLDDLPLFVNQPKIKEFLDKMVFPFYFLDFETYQSGIPPYDGMKPYQQIPFQYSLHILQNNDAPLGHLEFLANENRNDWRTLAEQLVKDIPQDGGSVISYNDGFEKARIKEMASIFPDLAEPLLGINARMVDLLDVFQGGLMYNQAMGGSFSIKSVLPALVPNNPELDYKANEDVQHGMAATQAFLSLKYRTPAERERIRQNLLKYCGLDTLAMVVIYRELCRYVK
jgi:hypothetical protein